MPDRGERARIAERRGGWTFVLFAGPEGQGACLMPDDLVGLGGQTAAHHDGFFGTGDPDPAEAPTVARDGIVETESMAGSTDEGWFTWSGGYVGNDVTGVTVHTPLGDDVEASVDGGRFAAWWPGGEVRGDNPGVSGAWTYTVSLADGSTRRATG
jgi:hypothetical protein